MVLLLVHPTQNLVSSRLTSFSPPPADFPSRTRGAPRLCQPLALGPLQSTRCLCSALAQHTPRLDHSCAASLLGPSSLFSTLELDWSVTVQMWPHPFSAWTPLVPPLLIRQRPDSELRVRLEAAFLLGAALVKAVILNSMRLYPKTFLILIHFENSSQVTLWSDAHP